MMWVEQLNAWGAMWFGFVARGLIDTTVLLVLMLVVWLPLRRRVSAHLAHGLFCLILVKLIVPIPVSWSWLGPIDSVRIAVERFASWAPATPTPNAPATVAEPVRAEPVVLSTTGDVAATLADAAPDQPIVITGPRGVDERSANGPKLQAQSARVAAPALSFQAWLMIGWAAGAALLLARLARGVVKTRRLIREALELRPELLPVDVDALRRAVGVRMRVRWAVNFDLHSPAVGGLLWPTVVIPPDLDESLTPKQLAWVLLHELAHIRRGDLWVIVVQRAVQAVFFFNPAVHVANWLIDELREYACDDAALAACKTSRRDCGEGFIAVIERSIQQAPVAAPALGLFESRMQIRRRLLRILDSRRKVHAGLSVRAAISLSALALFVVVCGRPGDVLARVNNRMPEPPISTLIPAQIDGSLDAPASYRPGMVWRRAAQARVATKRPDSPTGSRAVTLALAYSPDGSILAAGGDDSVVELRDVASGRVIRRLEGHRDAVSCLAFAPDGRTLATGSYDRTVKLWDVFTGREKGTLSGHTNWIFAVAFSPDGRSIASAGHDKIVRVWDAATGRSTAILAGHSASVRAVAFAPGFDGGQLASGGSDRVVLIWDLRTRSVRARLAGHKGTVRALAYATDGQILATGAEDGEVRLWDASLGRERAALLGHSDMVTCLAFAPRGATLATGSLDRTVKLWDTRTGRERASLQGHLDGVSAVAFAPLARQMATGGFDGSVRFWEPAAPMFSPAACLAYRGEPCHVAFDCDGRSLRVAGESGIAEWNIVTGSPLRKAAGGAATAIATAPDGKTYATGGPDGVVRVLDAATENVLATFLSHKAAVRSIGYSPDSRILASGDALGAVRLWNVRSRDSLGSIPGEGGAIACVTFSPDGRTLAAAMNDDLGKASAKVMLWDVVTWLGRGTLVGPAPGFASIAFSPDGATIATAGADGLVRLWDATTLAPRSSFKYSRCHSVAFSPDGHLIASSHVDGDAVLWDAQSGQQVGLLKGHRGAVKEVAFAPDGRLLATAGKDQTVKLWNLTTRRQTARATLKGDLTPVWSVAYSPDGQTLAVADGPFDSPGSVTLWDVVTRKVKATLDGHERGVNTVVFAPDGKTFASGGWDGTIRIWDAQTLEPRHVLEGLSGLTELAFSPDGRLLASAGEGDVVTLWDVGTGTEASRLTGFRLPVQCVSFSPDGRLLATGGGDNRPGSHGEVKIWDVANQSLAATMEGHERAVVSIAFSPDGTELATGGLDETIRLWDVHGRRERLMLGGLSNCAQALAYSRDGRTLAWSGRSDGLVSLHDTRTGAEIVRLVGHSAVVQGVAFAPSGRGLATGSADRTIKLWDVPALESSRPVARIGKPDGSAR
jgi:WD40 repeat protein/beta-lactamase regulating signal transducer with metallopeptidase domain